MRWLKSCFPDPAGDDAFSRVHWGGLAWFSFAFFWLNVLFLRYLDVFNYPVYLWLAGREDGLIENLTALLLFVAALLMLGTAARGKGRFRRVAGLLGGLALLFVAGEEVNWGQRILGFATPGLLGGLNAEANIHNLPGLLWRIEVVFNRGVLVLLLLGTAAFALRKRDLGGLPLPALPLLLTLPILFNWTYEPIGGAIDWAIRGPVDLIFKRAGLFLLFFLIWAGWTRDGRLLTVAAATLICLLVLSYMDYYALGHTHYRTEMREYVFSLAALLYAWQIAGLNPAAGRKLADRGSGVKAGWSRWSPRRFMHGRPISGQQGAGQRFSGQRFWGQPGAGGRWVWLAAGLLLTGGSLLLPAAHWQFTDANLRYYQSLYSSIRFGLWGPAAAADKFDLYFKQDGLAYIREPCRAEDAAEPFLLHFIPVDAGDLPSGQRAKGFHNRDFSFDDRARWLPRLPGKRTVADFSIYRRGLVFDGKCVALATLPDYPLAAIRTGQYRSDGSQTWVAELDVGP